MASSGMLRRVTIVRIDVSKELRASFIRVTRIGELGATQRNIPEDVILHSHRRENLKSYIRTQFVPHMKRITSPLHSPAG
jgi:hypothetical protein